MARGILLEAPGFGTPGGQHVVRHLRRAAHPGRKSARTGLVSLTRDCLSLASSSMVSMQGGFNHGDTTAV